MSLTNQKLAGSYRQTLSGSFCACMRVYAFFFLIIIVSFVYKCDRMHMCHGCCSVAGICAWVLC